MSKITLMLNKNKFQRALKAEHQIVADGKDSKEIKPPEEEKGRRLNKGHKLPFLISKK